MRKNILKKLLIILMFILITIVFPNKVLGINDDIIILERENSEYLIYVKDNSNKFFYFALSNNPNEDDSSLSYITSTQEGNGMFVAYIDNKISIDMAKPIYIWAKADEMFFLEAIELDLSDSIKESEIDVINMLTKKINIDTTKKEIVETIVNDVKITTVVGYIEVLESEEEVYYILEKLEDTNSTLLEKLEKLNKINVTGSVYEKLQAYKEFYYVYMSEQSIKLSDTWTRVGNDLKIFQPTTSLTGNKYIVWLKKVTPAGDVIDIQFLTSYREEDREFTGEGRQSILSLPSSLPITYDSIILLVILGVAVIGLIAVIIIRKKVKNKSKGE